MQQKVKMCEICGGPVDADDRGICQDCRQDLRSDGVCPDCGSPLRDDGSGEEVCYPCDRGWD